MSTQLTREQHEMVVRVLNLAELREYNDQLAQHQRRLAEAKEQLDTGRISQTAYNTIIKANAEALTQLNSRITTLQGSTRDYRQGIMSLSYAFNDFFSVSGSIQQRIISISNNLPGLAAGFGGVQSKLFQVGLAASGLLPVLAQLGSQLDFKEMAGFKSKFAVHTASLDELKKKIEAWKQKPPEIPLDLKAFDEAERRLDRLQKATQAYEATRQTAEKADIAGQASAAVRETIGSEQLARAFAQDMIAKGDKSAIPQELLDKNSQLEKLIPEREALADRLADKGRVEDAQQARASARQMREQLEATNLKIEGAVAGAAKEKAGLVAAGDVGAIAAASRLPLGVLGEGGRDFLDRVAVLPKSAADIRAIREDEQQRAIDAETEAKERIAGQATERQDEANRDDASRRRQDTKDTVARQKAAKDRVKAEGADAFKAIIQRGFRAGRPAETVRALVIEEARKQAQDLGVNREDLDPVSLQVGTELVPDGPQVGGTVPRKVRRPGTPLTNKERIDRARARQTEQARGRVDAQAAEDAQEEAEDRAEGFRDAGIRPGVVVNPAQAAAMQGGGKAGTVEGLRTALAEQMRLNAELMAQIQQINAMFGGMAQGVSQQRQFMIERSRSMQINSQSYMTGF